LASRFKRKEVKQMLYAVLAALLSFVGPTYSVAVVGRVIPQMYATTLGFVSFLVGVVFVFKLVEE